MANLLVYSTDYHLQQVGLINSAVVAKFRIGFKQQSALTRGFELLSCVIQIASRYRRSRIYIPRSAAKDNWIVYALFQRRCILISDGLSDFLDVLSVVNIGWMTVSFKESVDPSFHLKSRSLLKRQISFDALASVAFFNKRGRDPDYVGDFVRNIYGEQAVVNPLEGRFSQIYAAPSTVLFELPQEMKLYVTIVSQSHCITLDANRRSILAAYEQYLSKFGYRVI